ALVRPFRVRCLPCYNFRHESSRVGHAQAHCARSAGPNDSARALRTRLWPSQRRPPGEIFRPQPRWLEPRRSAEAARSYLQRSAHQSGNRGIPLRDRRLRAAMRASFTGSHLATLFLLCTATIAAGCQSSTSHTSNPQLKQIDELLAKQLPPGSPASRVNFFLTSRGYPIEDSHQQHLLIALVEHVDTETLQPSAARVTFHFDTNDKLLTYDLVAVPPSAVH